MTGVKDIRKQGPSICGSSYHGISTCLACKRIWARKNRANKGTKRSFGFKGPECFECGGTKSKVMESGYSDDGLRIRRRECMDCGQSCASVEVYIDPNESTFWKLNGKRIRNKRDNDYIRKGKGMFRAQVKWRDPDRLDVRVRVIKAKQRQEAA